MSNEDSPAMILQSPDGSNRTSIADGAQTSLFCILNDAADLDNGAFYSQTGPYVDKAARKGGWPLKEFPNKNATPENAARLWEISEKLIET
eukprot:scaffold558_cov111-Cylindrotheca_fusiformis.AAC.6